MKSRHDRLTAVPCNPGDLDLDILMVLSPSNTVAQTVEICGVHMSNPPNTSGTLVGRLIRCHPKCLNEDGDSHLQPPARPVDAPPSRMPKRTNDYSPLRNTRRLAGPEMIFYFPSQSRATEVLSVQGLVLFVPGLLDHSRRPYGHQPHNVTETRSLYMRYCTAYSSNARQMKWSIVAELKATPTYGWCKYRVYQLQTIKEKVRMHREIVYTAGDTLIWMRRLPRAQGTVKCSMLHILSRRSCHLPIKRQHLLAASRYEIVASLVAPGRPHQLLRPVLTPPRLSSYFSWAGGGYCKEERRDRGGKGMVWTDVGRSLRGRWSKELLLDEVENDMKDSRLGVDNGVSVSEKSMNTDLVSGDEAKGSRGSNFGLVSNLS
ncbi:hypothetical protein IMY05_C4419000700 [Salix suchowensis]|nr:hypothetical protein IMY05_C4419000700 [Salix suchowensis]